MRRLLLVLFLFIIVINASHMTSKNDIPIVQVFPSTTNGNDQSQLTSKIEELTRSVAMLKQESGNLDDLIKNEPWLNHFKQSGQPIASMKITLAGDENTSVNVTDRGLLSAFSGELVIRRELFGVNSGGSYNSDILPCHYQVKFENNETFGISLPARGVLTFDQLPNHAFETNPYLHQACVALVGKPSYLPDQTLFAKMADSGMLITNSDGVIYFSANRIHAVIYALLQVKRSAIPHPSDVGDSKESMAFFSFGEKVTMNVFEQYIQIIDNNEEVWYKVERDVPMQIRSVLSAG